jgi:putative phage-type endonuclease
MKNYEIVSVEQGSQEWHILRKTKITATDAVVIMHESHWTTPLQLYNEKLSGEPPRAPNERMQRGTDLEPVARQSFIEHTGIEVVPMVVVKDWAMASLDGMSLCGKHIVEIKCPGAKDHATALQGKVPDHYRAQLQHQMYVTGLQEAYYYSFDGQMGTFFTVKRDDQYIEKMIEEEKKFYQNLMLFIPPESCETEYVEREDSEWEELATRWRLVTASAKELALEEEEIRKKLVSLSGECNVKGAGISLCQINRKGNVDYSKIPEIKNIDLDKYRKPTTSAWRITTNA